MTWQTRGPSRVNPPAVPTAVAVGTTGLLLVVDPGPPPVALGIASVLVAVVLGGTAIRTGAPVRALAWSIGSFAVLGGVAFGILGSGRSLPLAALGLGLAFAAISYTLHRYELVQLGLVGGDGA